jgi:capsular exopolysaccharide synthesis family protein
MHVNKEFDVDILLNSIKRSWFWILLVGVILYAAAFLYLRYTKLVFESGTTIQLVSKDEGQKIVDIENINAQGGELQEELELLRSELLLNKTLKYLNLSVGYFAKGQILTEEKYTNSSFLIQPLKLPDSTFAGTSIFLVKSNNSYQLAYNFGGEEIKIDVKDGEEFETPHFKAYFRVTNTDLFEKAISENELYFTFNDYAKLTQVYLSSLSVNIVNKDAKTIHISHTSNNALLSRDIVKAHTKVFFRFDQERKSRTSSDILNFIEKQLDSVRNELVSSEDSLKQFKQVNRENLAHQPAQGIYEKINVLQSKLVANELDLQLLNEVQTAVTYNESRIDVYNLIAATIGSQFENSLGQQLKGLHKLMLDKETLLFSRTPENSKVKIITQEIETQISSIVNIVKALKVRLAVKTDVLQDDKRSLEQNFIELPDKEMGLTRLNRMYELNEKYYMLLLEKKTQYSISEKGFHSSNLILTEPVASGDPISPNTRMIKLAAIVFSIVIGLIIIMVRYLLFNEIQSQEELKKLLGPTMGFLGVVPKYKKNIPNSQIVVHLSPKSAISESFRNIRTNIQFLKKENSKGTIAISSSVSGEGKTFVALNLAGIIALSGKKTILIDLDLRKPKVHLGFGVDNKIGMSTVLSGSTELKDCINKSEVDGLDYITAGPIPPNPSELIINDKIKEVISQLEEEYDQVIIDNPPIGLISDGLHIYNLVDIPIYIYRTNYSKRNFSVRINELVEEGKIKNLSVILNGFSSSRKGYGYGYGYGNYYEEN